MSVCLFVVKELPCCESMHYVCTIINKRTLYFKDGAEIVDDGYYSTIVIPVHMWGQGSYGT